MARVLTNNVGLQFAIEASIGVLPGTPAWKTLEPNSIGAYGAVITPEERRPISAQRGRRKGTVVDLDSSVEWDADLTLSAFEDFAEGFVFAEYRNVEFDLKDGTGTVPPPATGTGYTIDAATALLAGKVQWVTLAQASLVWARGYANAANNGLKPITVDLATSGTEITVSGLVVETPPVNASLQVAGIRVTDADLTLTESSGTATLVSAGDVSDWATLGIVAGMEIHIGSPDANGVVQNALQDLSAGAADDTYGYARVTSVAGATLNLDKLDINIGSPPSADNTGTGDADVLFGRFLRNVAVDADADDTRYLERSYQFEASYPDGDGAGVDTYEYAIGNFASGLTMNIGLAAKADASWNFIGTNSDDVTITRKTAAATAVDPLRTVALNTSSDMAALTTDLVSAVSDVCFKSITLTIGNNVTPEKCVGILGASFVNTGLFEVNFEGQMLFTRKEMTNAIKNNTTSTFQSIFRNEDGAISIDIPALTFGGGQREYPVDASVIINLTGLAFNDPSGTIPNVSLGITIFPVVPWA